MLLHDNQVLKGWSDCQYRSYRKSPVAIASGKEDHTMIGQTLAAGDFTGLAGDYSNSRPDYSPSALSALIGLLEKPISEVDFVDLGAGTGIWTRMVAGRGARSVSAVEPNDDMRRHGEHDSAGTKIRWFAAGAERTGLQSASCDWVTMASSFHWVDFDAVTHECSRILRSGGRFTALWNPRLINVNPLLVEIEEELKLLCPDIKRVSSGLSGITETLNEKLWSSPYFEDVVYIEGRHVIAMSPARYLGVWRSVNDLRVQMGETKFANFLSFIDDRISGVEIINATYLTRAWSARRKD